MNYMRLEDIIDLDGVLNTKQLQKIDQIIQALLITRQGTIPGSRSFGLSGTAVDAPHPAALNTITVDLAEQIAQYAPDVQLDRVEATEIGADGVLGLTVYIGGN